MRGEAHAESSRSQLPVLRLRSREQVILTLCVYLFMSVLYWSVLPQVRTVGARTALAVVWILYTVPVLRGVFVVVIAYPDGRLTIRNVLRTHHLTASEIRRFRVGRWGLAPRMGLVDLTDGSSRHMLAVVGPDRLVRPRNRSTESSIDELSKWLSVARS